jgi:U3 small nucleolar RNA-associated protein 10
VVKATKRTVVKNSTTALFEILLKAFDHRRLAVSDSDQLDDIDRIESIYIDIAFAVVQKIDDTTFRPFFIKMADWAGSLPKKDTAGQVARATVLYKFLTVLFSNLKVCAYPLALCEF